jgi:hypothetical protein
VIRWLLSQAASRVSRTGKLSQAAVRIPYRAKAVPVQKYKFLQMVRS